MSSCAIYYDAEQEILYMDDSGHDNGGIGSQSWAIYETSGDNVQGSLKMDSGVAGGLDDFDYSNPVTYHPFLPDHFPISYVQVDNSGVGAYEGWVNFRVWTSPAYTNTRNCYTEISVYEATSTEPEASTTWSVASTSQEQGLNSIALGVAILITVMFIAVSAYIWNALYKKPWL